jgi:hypothetical protein
MLGQLFILSTGLHYKDIMIINDDSSIINNFGASQTEAARVIIYNHHMFIVQATGQPMACTINM